MPGAPADLIEQIYWTGQVEAADGTPRDAFPAAMPRFHSLEIERLVRDMRLTRTLETGMAYGLSSLAICSVHAERGDGRHIAVDPHQSTDWGGIGVLNLRRAGVEALVRVIEARSDEALPRLRDEGVRIDFALLDGLHLFDATLVDFFHADRMLEVGGVVVFHDTWMPAVAQAVAFVRANRAYEPIEAGDAAMVALRKTAEDDRPWDFHGEFMRTERRLPRWGTARRRLARRLRAPRASRPPPRAAP
jgi:predicted O-methyltransferase YrrM